MVTCGQTFTVTTWAETFLSDNNNYITVIQYNNIYNNDSTPIGITYCLHPVVVLLNIEGMVACFGENGFL